MSHNPADLMTFSICI